MRTPCTLPLDPPLILTLRPWESPIVLLTPLVGSSTFDENFSPKWSSVVKIYSRKHKIVKVLDLLSTIEVFTVADAVLVVGQTRPNLQ